MKKIVKKQTYSNLITDIASLIEHGRKTAVLYVNTALVVTYWLIGRRIIEYEQKGKKRAEYGEALLKKMSVDLTKRFGKGFTERNIEHIRQFYLTYPEISHTVCAKLEEKTIKEKSHTVCAELTQFHEKMPVNFETLAQKFPLSWSHYRLLT